MLTLNSLYLIYLGLKNPIKKKKKHHIKVFITELLHCLCYVPLFLLVDDVNENTS